MTVAAGTSPHPADAADEGAGAADAAAEAGADAGGAGAVGWCGVGCCAGCGGAGVGVSFFCIFDIPFLGDFFFFFLVIMNRQSGDYL